MSRRLTADERLDARVDARQRRDERAYHRAAAREEAAERQVGELCRDGRQVFYVMPAGGRYREGSRLELVAYLIRNRSA